MSKRTRIHSSISSSYRLRLNSLSNCREWVHKIWEYNFTHLIFHWTRRNERKCELRESHAISWHLAYRLQLQQIYKTLLVPLNWLLKSQELSWTDWQIEWMWTKCTTSAKYIFFHLHSNTLTGYLRFKYHHYFSYQFNGSKSKSWDCELSGIKWNRNGWFESLS